jgi:hypothetical protein
MSDWIGLPPEEEIDNWYGFVYKITRTNALPGEKKYYIGCKRLKSITHKPPLKGKTRKRKIIKNSDYLDYYGSSEELKFLIKKYGKKNFKREVLKMVTCQWQLRFEELRYQIQENVLFRDDYMNGIINVRLGRAPKALEQEYKINCE